MGKKRSTGGDQAFPTIKTEYLEDGEPAGVVSTGGLTKREFVAAMALMGHMASPNPRFDMIAAGRCAEAADCLLEELSRNGRKDG